MQQSSELADSIPEAVLGQAIDGHQDWSLAHQFYCLLGGRLSYVSSIRTGEWQGFHPPLTVEQAADKASVVRVLADSQASVWEVVGCSSTEHYFDEVMRIVEHEKAHHVHMIWRMRRLGLLVPEGVAKTYHLSIP